MASDQQFIIGADVEVTFSDLATGATSVQNWTKVTIALDTDVARFKPASSRRRHWRYKTYGYKVTLEGYAGGAETLADLPQNGTEIKAISIQTVTEGAELMPLLSDANKYGKVGVVSSSCDIGEDSANWRIEAESGFEPDMLAGL